MAALLLTTALAGPAAAGPMVPFRGTIEGTEDFDFDHPSGIDLKISGSGGGNATRLGNFTATWVGDITFGEEFQPLERTFVAANGDELWSTGFGAGTEPDPDQFVVENYDIIGGTGRFEDATGSFTVERTVFNVSPPFTDLETVGSFDGFISTVGSTKRFQAVPEPASMTLALGCVLGLVTCVRRRTKGR